MTKRYTLGANDNTKMNAPLPKSLHTVTVLVNLARHLNYPDANDAVTGALFILGYHDADASTDIHGLRDKAVAILRKTTYR